MTPSSFSQLYPSMIVRCVALAVLLVALAWSLTSCGSSSAARQGGSVATNNGDLERFKTLLKGNPDIIFSKDEYGQTPLHHAAENGQKDMVELLLSHGADVNARNNMGQTPLHYAADRAPKEVVELLLAHGAAVNAKDTDGNTPLRDAAISSVGKDMAELLRQHGGHE